MSGFNIGIGIGLKYNRPILGKINAGEIQPQVPSPIASYRCYDKTNDDSDRDVLTDLTGNGHDIQLYNFAFTEESGYNKSTYNGALVSDGVDDYGLCENFPLLDKEKGYTICMIRKIPSGTSSTAYILSNSSAVDMYDGFCDFEKNYNSTTISWGGKSSCTLPELFTYQTSTVNNGSPIIKGDSTGTNKLSLFTSHAGHTDSANIAFYALEIYDRDLTDEEIEKVKERMIAEYEEKTGNKYDNYIKLNESKLDIAKLK